MFFTGEKEFAPSAGYGIVPFRFSIKQIISERKVFRRIGYAKERGKHRNDIQMTAHFAVDFRFSAGDVNHKRGVYLLFVECRVVSQSALFKKLFSVVTDQNDDGIIVQIVFLKGVKNLFQS